MVIPNPVIDNEPEPDIRSHTHHGSTPHNNINTPASQPPSPLIVPGPRHSVPSTIMSDDDRDDADTPNKDPTPWQSFKNMLRAQPLLCVLPALLPIAWALHFTHQNPIAVFVTSLLAIVPLAGGLSFATEELATRIGDAWGGLLNATFGNAVELLVAILALVKGDLDIVQASMAGSILSNILLVLGMSYFAGGLRFHEQLYGVVGAQTNISLLSITVAAVLLPEAYHLAFPDTAKGAAANTARGSAADLPAEEMKTILAMSRGLSFILLFVYGVYLTFQLWTHAYLFKKTREEPDHLPNPSHERVFPRPSWVPSLRTVTSRTDTMDTRPGSPVVVRVSYDNTTDQSSSPSSTAPRFRSGSIPDPHAGHLHFQTLAAPDQDIRWREKRADVDTSPTSAATPTDNANAVGPGATAPGLHHDVEAARPRLRRQVTHHEPRIGGKFALISLACFTGLAGLTAECLVDSIDGLTERTSVSREFVGLILLPVIGNSVEHITAVTVSLKDRLNLSLSIAVGSSIQVSLCLLPLLVLLGWAIGQPMTLLFDTFETICLVIGVVVVNFAIADGRTNYLEGAVLMATYVCIALVCWFYDPVH